LFRVPAARRSLVTSRHGWTQPTYLIGGLCSFPQGSVHLLEASLGVPVMGLPRRGAGRAGPEAMLDEGLEVLAGLWSGEPFGHQGEHYRIAGDPPEQDWRAVY
jgi:hypothetical protein